MAAGEVVGDERDEERLTLGDASIGISCLM
jgi:hypothetical protein